MPTNWENRRDLDRVRWLVDELDRLFSANGVSNFKELLNKYYDQSEIDLATSKLNKDLTALNSSLDVLNSSLVDFNAGLIDFDEDNTNLDEDLTKLKDNLLSFLDVLGLLDVDLTALQSSLTTLEGQINGTDGLSDVLEALQVQIYGDDPEHPSSDSLRGMLDEFGAKLNDLDSGDTKLSLTLSTLSGYLTTFKGSLAELEAQIKSDYGQTFYEGLDEDLVKLIASITQANDDLEAHQDLIDDIGDTIGSSSDTGNTTLYGKLYNTASVASSASTKANSVESTITNTISPNLTQVKDVTIPAIKTKMGYDSIGNTSLQSQISTTDGKVDTINDTTIPSINAKIGTVDVATDGSLQSQINNTNGSIDNLGVAIGDTSGISGSVVSNITTIKDTTIPAIKTKMGYDNIGNTNLQSQINNTNGAVNTINNTTIPAINNKIGNVDVSTDGSLQSQINSTNSDVSGINTVIGNTSQISGSLISNINAVIGDISEVQTDIGDMTQLSADLASSISTSQGLISDVQDDIGDINTSGTIKYNLNQTTSTANGLKTDLYGSGGSSSNPADGSIKKNLNNAQSDIGYLQEGFDKFNLPSSNLDWTYLFSGTLDTQAVLILEQDYNIPTLAYAYKVDNKQWYVRNGSSFSTTSTAPTNPIAVCNQLPTASVVSGTSLSFLAYELLSMKYYTYSSNVWNEQTDLSDFFTHTMMYENIDTDFARQVDLEEVDFSHSVFRENIVRLFPLIIEVDELPFAPNSTKVVADEFGYAYAYVTGSHTYDGQTISYPRYYKVQWNSTTSKNEWIVMQQEADAFQDSELYVWISQYFRNKSNNIYASSLVSEGAFGVIGSSGQDQESINSVIDVKLDAMDNWTSVNLNNSYATLYVNEAIRMCDFHYQRDFTSATADTNYSWHTGLIPSDYRPITQATGSFNFLGTLIINTNGNVGGRFVTTWTNSSRTVQGSAMWHY